MQFTATGFLYGYPTGRTNEDGQETYRLFLITNRHVIESASANDTRLHARFNRPMGADPSVYPLPITKPDGSTLWVTHPKQEIDVAVLSINGRQLRDDGIEFVFFASDKHTLTLEQARENGMSEGDGIFVLGFPLGEAGEERNYTVVRQGILARVQDWLKGNAHSYLVDASIFPGNSGGPVLIKPEIAAIQGTKSNNTCALIGMVSSYLPYREVALSQQTGRPRMIFEENSGLATVVPQDVINEAVQVAAEAARVGETSIQEET